LKCTYSWRGEFESIEYGVLHADAFGPKSTTDDETDWQSLTAKHSLGWVTARAEDNLVGFVNVVWDGHTHAWIQDVMMNSTVRHFGIGTQLITNAREACAKAGCE
jgi:hypothetical protein